MKTNMATQLFLLGKLDGIESFILEQGPEHAGAALAGRCLWISLLSEVLPRAVLAECGLAELLLGVAGGGEFLIVLPEESLGAAETVLSAAATEIKTLSGGLLRLLWTSTENLGAWPFVRGRLLTQLRQKEGAPGPTAERGPLADDYFAELAASLAQVQTPDGTQQQVGWSMASPGKVTAGSGDRTFTLGDGAGEIPLARHQAMSEDGTTPARLKDLAARAQGAKRWGVLRGDVDGFGARLRGANTVEEHVKLALALKQFLTGEVRVLALQGEFFRRVSLLWVGGDDFAVYGSWDALIEFGREIHRVFHRFTEEQWSSLLGREGKTISMALAIAPQGANDAGASFRAVYEEAGRALEVAKSEDKDCFYVLGRAIEWKQLQRSSDLKASMIRLVREFGCSADFLQELSGFFHDRLALPGRERTDRPWRYHRRISAALGDPRRANAAFDKQKTALIRDLIGGGSAHARLRPTGRVAVDWARLELGL